MHFASRFRARRFALREMLRKKLGKHVHTLWARSPGEVTQCSAPGGRVQPGRICISRFSSKGTRTMKSGRTPMSKPAIKAGNIASPLLTRR